MKNIKAVVFDLDGTLCESSQFWRPEDYGTETVAIKMRNTLNSYRLSDVRIIILTWRKSDKHRITTQLWLNHNYIIYDRLYMQEASTAVAWHIFKQEVLNKLKDEFDIVWVYDDDLEVWRVCEDLWIKFLKC